jgi:hypothetical protein
MTVVVITPNLVPFDPYRTPLINRAALMADHRAALASVPGCMAWAVLLPEHGELFGGSHRTVFHPDPDGKHADQIIMPTSEYAIMCELKRFGGYVSIHDNGKGRKDLVSTHSLGGGLGTDHLMVSRIMGDAERGETVRGAAHVETVEAAIGTNAIPSGTPAVTQGASKRGARAHAIFLALQDGGRLARKLGLQAYDFEGWLSNLHDLFACRDEMMAAIATLPGVVV